MKNNKISLLVENSIVHKETIAPSISGAISNVNHYNAKNSIYPEVVGRGNYLSKISEEYFNSTLNKVKKIHGIEDINPKVYFGLKKNIGKIIGQINAIESNNKKKLNELAETMIRRYLSVPSDITFHFNDSDDMFTEPHGNNVLDEYKDSYEDFVFDNYSGIQQANQKVDRDRLNYSLICGGANHCMNLYKNYENELDNIDYRLSPLYDKFNSFNNFNLWVTPDDILTSDIDDIGGFKIFDNNGGYVISVDAPNFLSRLYEMAKGVLSILFQEKYNNPYVDYENPWNTRIGSMAWNKLLKCANKRKQFPYVIDAINDLNDDDYSYVMKEVLADTKHSKKIFEELYEML